MYLLLFVASQEDLDEFEKAEIDVRTKAPELIGRLACVLFIYEQAFRCLHEKRPFQLETKVPAKFVERAEQCVRTSYAHAETYTSVSTFTYGLIKDST